MSNKQYEPTYEGQLDKCQDERHALQMQLEEAWDDLAKMKAERDEARKEVCQIKGTTRFAPHYPFATPRQYASIRGWDCYGQEDKPCAPATGN